MVGKLVPIGTQHKDSIKHLSCGIYKVLLDVDRTLIGQTIKQKLVQVMFLIYCYLQTESVR